MNSPTQTISSQCGTRTNQTFAETIADVLACAQASLGMPWDIPVNSEFDIQGIRAAARAAREVLDLATAAVSQNGVGMTTEELDELVHTETIKRGGYPSPLNYHGFPKSVCTSINEVVCHGIPAPNVVLKEGDTLNIDVTVYLNGYHGDCSEMACVGEVDEAGKKLIQTTYDAWQVVCVSCQRRRGLADPCPALCCACAVY